MVWIKLALSLVYVYLIEKSAGKSIWNGDVLSLWC